MSKICRNALSIKIKKHLERCNNFIGVDLRFYSIIAKKILEGNVVEGSNIYDAKVSIVKQVLDDIEKGSITTFHPITFKTQCCNVEARYMEKPRQQYSCPNCHSSIGAHKDYMPMGELADKKIRKLRVQLHNILDGVWSGGLLTRNQAYERLSNKLNLEREHSHIGNVSSEIQAAQYYSAIQWLKGELQ